MINCSVCGNYFSILRSLKKHIGTIHDLKYEYKERNLKQHLKCAHRNVMVPIELLYWWLKEWRNWQTWGWRGFEGNYQYQCETCRNTLNILRKTCRNVVNVKKSQNMWKVWGITYNEPHQEVLENVRKY